MKGGNVNRSIEIDVNNVNQYDPAGIPVAGGNTKTPSVTFVNNVKRLPISFPTSIIDGFHDFCKGGRVAGNVDDEGEEDVGGDIVDVVKNVYAKLGAAKLNLMQPTGDATEQVNSMIATMTNAKVGSVSEYEKRCIAWFESRGDMSSILGSIRKRESIQNIINAPNTDKTKNNNTGARPLLWRQLCGEVLPPVSGAYTQSDRNAQIAAGPALYDKALDLYWDTEYSLPAVKDDNTLWNPAAPLTQPFQVYQEVYLKRLASFIFTYFYPELSWSDADQEKTAMVFDMASGCLGTIFGSFDSGFFRSAICPQTVSDSAGTSLKQVKHKKLGELNRFNFHTTNDLTLPIEAGLEDKIKSVLIASGAIKRPNIKYYKAQGNVLTWEFKYGPNVVHTRIVYVIESDSEYSEKNYCNFSVCLCFRVGQGEWDVNPVSFGLSTRNGPSVAYLSSLVYALEIGKPLPSPPPNKSMVNITDTINTFIGKYPKELLQALLFDFKRCGDWEQSRAAQLSGISAMKGIDSAGYKRYLFGTGDRLCSFFSRLSKGNCAWHNEGKGGSVAWSIELYRNPNITEELPQEIKISLEIVRQSTTVEKLLDRICHASRLMASIQNIKRNVYEHGNTAEYWLSKKKPSAEGSIRRQIERLLTQISRIGMRDIYFKCCEFEKVLQNPDNILRQIVGPIIEPGNICQIIGDVYVIGLNYLRDIFTKMKVKSKASAQLFLILVNAPNVGGEPETNYFIQYNINSFLPKVDLPQSLASVLQASDETAVIKVASRIIFSTNPAIYDGSIEERIEEFMALVMWLRAVRKQGSVENIQSIVNRYANAIIGNPVEDVKRAVSLIRQLKSTVRDTLVVPSGEVAINEYEPIKINSKKKTIKDVLTLGQQLPIIQRDVQNWIFNPEFQSYGAFKFSVKNIKDSKIDVYLIKMFDLGLLPRIRFTVDDPSGNVLEGKRIIGQPIKLEANQWVPFANHVFRTIPKVQSQMPQRDQNGNEINKPLKAGWVDNQISSSGLKSFYVNSTVNSAWPRLSDFEKNGYVKILDNICDFDCPMIYTLIRYGTFGKEYITKLPAAQALYCQSVFCSVSNKPIVEGLDISELGKSKYTENRNVDNVAEEISKFSRWLAILLDIGPDYNNGLSPFTNSNLQKRGRFLELLKTNMLQSGPGQEVVRDIGYFDEFDGATIPAKFVDMTNTANNIMNVGSVLPPCLPVAPQYAPQAAPQFAPPAAPQYEEQEDQEMAGNNVGGSKQHQSGGNLVTSNGLLPLSYQKQMQLNDQTNLFLEIIGDARSFIAPLTNPKNLIDILQKIISGLQAQQRQLGQQTPALFVQLIQDAQKTGEAWTSIISQANAAYDQQFPFPQKPGQTEEQYFYIKKLQIDENLTVIANQRNLFFNTINIYSVLINANIDFDFLGVNNLFQEINSKINGFVIDKSNPLTDNQFTPYQGYDFMLLDSFLKLLVMFNNTHVYNSPPQQPQGQQQQSEQQIMESNTLLLTRLDSTTLTEYNLDAVLNARNQDGGVSVQRKNQLIATLPSFGNNDKLKQTLVELLYKSSLETSPAPVNAREVERRFYELLNNDIRYSQSNMATPNFLLPQIKLMLALSGLQSFLFVKNNMERLKDPVFIMLFANKDAIRAGTTIDFAWENWQNNKIMQRFYMILQRIDAFENTGTYTPLQKEAVSLVQGRKKNKTKKKRKKKKKTRKAKKKRQNKKKKTRVKRDKRKRKKTRGRKKKN